MLYTVTIHYKTDRGYTHRNRVEANSPQEAKEIALRGLLESKPGAKIIRQRAQKSHKTPT